MANTKNKHSFLKGTLIVLGTCVGLGGIATGAYYIGQALGYDTSISVSSYFDELNIATTQIATYTGAAIEPTLDLTEDFTYTIRSIKDSEENEVESAVEIGTYTFVVRIVYTGGSINSYRDYEIELTIQTGVSLNVQENQNSTLLKISKQLLTSGTDDSGYEYQEVSYEVNGTLSASAVEGSLSWAETTVKTMSEYMTFSIDTSAQTVRLTCLQAFDTQIVFTLTSTELNTATASLTIDYQQKVLSEPSNNVYLNSSLIETSTIDELNENDTILITQDGGEYSQIYTISIDTGLFSIVNNVKFVETNSPNISLTNINSILSSYSSSDGYMFRLYSTGEKPDGSTFGYSETPSRGSTSLSSFRTGCANAISSYVLDLLNSFVYESNNRRTINFSFNYLYTVLTNLYIYTDSSTIVGGNSYLVDSMFESVVADIAECYSLVLYSSDDEVISSFLIETFSLSNFAYYEGAMTLENDNIIF